MFKINIRRLKTKLFFERKHFLKFRKKKFSEKNFQKKFFRKNIFQKTFFGKIFFRNFCKKYFFWEIKKNHKLFFWTLKFFQKGSDPLTGSPGHNGTFLEPGNIIPTHFRTFGSHSGQKNFFRENDLFIPPNTLKRGQNDPLTRPPRTNGTLLEHGTLFSTRTRPIRTQWAKKKNFRQKVWPRAAAAAAAAAAVRDPLIYMMNFPCVV